MALQVIGAGFGRTGTLSLKHALQRLGFDPCYHMIEVFGNAGHAAQWAAATRGEPVDWDALFANYTATVDWPSCSFYAELAGHYPDAKVILSRRSAESWYESVSNTIYKSMTGPTPPNNPAAAEQMAMARGLIVDRTFGGRFEDKTHAIAVYEAHNAEVIRTIPADRLLVFEASQGWEPLCAFLGLPVPDEDYPRVNTTEDFVARRLAPR
ncbi:MAG: sulfotransferase family protein [Dehalococcoidia bacterium]